MRGDADPVAVGEHQRARVERVRRDEGEHHRIDAPAHDRAAGREVVAGRADGGRDHHTVAAALAHVDAVDLPAERRHAAVGRARDEHVVDGGVPPALVDRVSMVGRSTVSNRPRSTSGSRSARSFSVSDVRNPTRPKFTPITGTRVSRNRCRARSIVPSPPSTSTRSHAPDSSHGSAFAAMAGACCARRPASAACRPWRAPARAPCRAPRGSDPSRRG